MDVQRNGMKSFLKAHSSIHDFQETFITILLKDGRTIFGK